MPTVTGDINQIAGTAVTSGEVRFTATKPVVQDPDAKTTALATSVAQHTVTLGGTGSFSTTLPATGDDWVYRVEISAHVGANKVQGLPRLLLEVPASGADLSDAGVEGSPSGRVVVNRLVGNSELSAAVAPIQQAADNALTTAQSAESTADNAIGRVEELEILGGVAPGDPTDATIALHMQQPTSQTQAALNAQSVQAFTEPQTAVRIAVERGNIPLLQPMLTSLKALENKARNNPVRVVRLVTGKDDQTPTNLSGQAVTHGAVDGQEGWKVEASPTMGNLEVSNLALRPGPANAVSAWVYITDPSVVNNAQVYIYGPGGSWQRGYAQAGSNLEGKSLVKGWNLIRWSSTSTTNYKNLHQVDRVSVRVTISAPTTFYVGPVDIEVREKATAIIINDWGSKPFYDIGYPDLKARGWPVIWAPRSERFGEGTYPANMTSLEEVKTLASENGNEISYHSPDGTATSGLTPEQARENVIRCVVGLKVNDLYGHGALWRAAWVQNLAPNAWNTEDLMVVSATPKDRYHNTPWPALDRFDIPRNGIHGQGTAPSMIAQLKDTHQVGLFYTHAITPEGDQNHASQAQWDEFIAALDNAVAEGWMEVINMKTLLEREPVMRGLDTPVQLVDATIQQVPVTTTVFAADATPAPTALSGNTYTHVPDHEGRQAWKVDTTNTVARADFTLPATVDVPGSPQEVTAWVYVTDAVAITSAQVIVRGAAGSWLRTSDQSGTLAGHPLTQGWNQIRFDAGASNPTYLDDVTSVDLRANVTPPTTVYVGAVTVESLVDA